MTKKLFNLNDADQEKLEALRVAWGIKTTVGAVRRLIREAQPSEVADLVTAARDASAMLDFLTFASKGDVGDGEALRNALKPFEVSE